MNLQSTKLSLISHLAQIQDELELTEIERFILNNQKESNQELKPFTIEEFISRIEEPEEDYNKGKFKNTR